MTIEDIKDVRLERDPYNQMIQLCIYTNDRIYTSKVFRTNALTSLFMDDSEVTYRFRGETDDGLYEIDIGISGPDARNISVRNLEFYPNHPNPMGDEYTRHMLELFEDPRKIFHTKAHHEKEQEEEMSDDTSEIDKFLDEFNIGK